MVRWCSGSGVGLVIERSQVRFPAGALPGSLGQLSLSSLRGRLITAFLAGVRRGAFTCVGWQVTLYDSIWQVTFRSFEMVSREDLYTRLPFLCVADPFLIPCPSQRRLICLSMLSLVCCQVLVPASPFATLSFQKNSQYRLVSHPSMMSSVQSFLFTYLYV